jgi:hypothetical protein
MSVAPLKEAHVISHHRFLEEHFHDGHRRIISEDAVDFGGKLRAFYVNVTHHF